MMTMAGVNRYLEIFFRHARRHADILHVHEYAVWEVVW